MIYSECKVSALLDPDPSSVSTQTIELMESASASIYMLPRLEDSGTQSLQAISGFASDTCGSFTYTMNSSLTWIIQDPSDELKFSIEVNEDPSLLGAHILTVEVASDDYSSEIAAKTISVPIFVRKCTDPLLLEPGSNPAITWEPLEYEDTESWSLPTYIICREVYTDLNFEFYDPSGNLIRWITADVSAWEFTAIAS